MLPMKGQRGKETDRKTDEKKQLSNGTEGKSKHLFARVCVHVYDWSCLQFSPP